MNLKCIREWDRCLPQPDELTPLSQRLIPHELAYAFNISPSSSSSTCTVAAPSVDALDASHSAFKSLLQIRNVLLPSSAESERNTDAEPGLPLYQLDDDMKITGLVQNGNEGSRHGLHGREAASTGPVSSCTPLNDYPTVSWLAPGIATGLSQLMSTAPCLHDSSYSHISQSTTADVSHPKALLGDGGAGISGSTLEAATLMQLKMDPSNETDSAPSMDFFQGSCLTMSSEEQSARTLKKQRLVWTPQLHKRFVDAVAHLGIKHAVPKTIMQLMNVDGLTRENVASHLQKYRLYLKRMQGFAIEGPSSVDQFFTSTPIPPSLAASAHYLVSHQNQHVDRSIGPVQNANLQSMLGHPAQHLIPSMSSPTPSLSGLKPLPSVLTLQTPPPPPPPLLISSDLGRESYQSQSGSAPGPALSLFPNSSK